MPIIISQIRLFLASLLFLLIGSLSAQTIDWTQKANPINLTINGVAFSSNGQKLLTGTNCHPASIRVFDVSNGNITWDYEVSSKFMCIMGVGFSSNSKYIAAIEEFGNIFIFDNSGAVPFMIDTIKTGTTYGFSVAISPANDKVAVGCSNGKLKIYNIPGGSLSNDISAHSSWVTSVTYSPDGTKVVTGGNDNKLKVWSNSGALLQTCTGHTDDITGIKITPDNKFIVSSAKDDKIKIWNIATGALVQTISGHTADVNGIDISPDGSMLVSASSDNSCKIWDINSGSLYRTFGVADSGGIISVAWSPLGNKIATGSVKSDLVLWSIPANLSLKEPIPINSLKVSPNPAKNQLTLQLSFHPKGAQLKIYNQLGQLQKTFNNLDSQIAEFDISDLLAGTYYLKLEDLNNNINSKFIILR